MCVLGGAGFIGSHLVEALLPIAKSVSIADNYSHGTYKNLPEGIFIHEVDLRDLDMCRNVICGNDIVFHLAADVGGRSYISNNPQKMWANLRLDATVFQACSECDIEKLVYFSSACVYPTNSSRPIFNELSVKNIEDADGIYGMQKLISEYMLISQNFESVRVRPSTVYGPRMKSGRAIMDFILKSLAHQEPFEIWGDSYQYIDWIYVDDVVRGSILATEKLENGVVNVGSGTSFSIKDVLNFIWTYIGWRPNEIKFLANMPTSPVRIIDSTKLKNLGWNREEYIFLPGLPETIAYAKSL